MDCLARGLIGAAKLVEEGLMDRMLSERYSTWSQDQLAKKVISGKATLEELEARALGAKEPEMRSGKQEQRACTAGRLCVRHELRARPPRLAETPRAMTG